MNETNVPISVDDVLGRLARALEGLPPELAKAALWILDHPNDVGVSSTRALAAEAGVKPNTLVRLARAVGFSGFEAFRAPFRARLVADSADDFTDRARWLQGLSQGDQHEKILAGVASASLNNLETLFSKLDHERLREAARAIVVARRSWVLGVGVANPQARTFAYLAGMAMDNVQAIPAEGALPVDALARAGAEDVLVAMTFHPYRREVIEAVELARDRGVCVIGISDSLASPVLSRASHGFVVPVDTPQFFTSTVALTALLEALMAYVISEASPDTLANIQGFHDRRHSLGIYWRPPA